MNRFHTHAHTHPHSHSKKLLTHTGCNFKLQNLYFFTLLAQKPLLLNYADHTLQARPLWLQETALLTKWYTAPGKREESRGTKWQLKQMKHDNSRIAAATLLLFDKLLGFNVGWSENLRRGGGLWVAAMH